MLESRRWFQSVVGLGGTAISLALAAPVYLALREQGAAAAIAVPFLTAGAIAGFSSLLTVVLPPVLVKLWPALERASWPST